MTQGCQARPRVGSCCLSTVSVVYLTQKLVDFGSLQLIACTLFQLSSFKSGQLLHKVFPFLPSSRELTIIANCV